MAKQTTANIISFDRKRQAQKKEFAKQYVSAGLEKKQRQFQDKSPSERSPREALRQIADVLEINAEYLVQYGSITKPVVNSLLDVTAYLHKWVD